MTEEIDLPQGPSAVLQSRVAVELENASGDVITVTRDARAASGNDFVQLVNVAHGAELTAPTGGHDHESFYVRRAGAAQDERGFHKFLADFLGWDLPLVPRYDSDVAPLYLEVLLPFFVVEQKSGWFGTVPRLPTYLRVRDPLARAAEFILGLTDGARVRAVTGVSARERELRSRYDRLLSDIAAAAHLHGADVVGLPLNPPIGREDGPGPLDARILILRDGTWTDLAEVLGELDAVAGAPLVTTDTETTPQPDQAQRQQLRRLEEQLRETTSQITAVESSFDMVSTQAGTLHTRMQHVKEERRRYQELRTLVALGAPVVQATVARDNCPTCQQSLVAVEHLHGEALDYEGSVTLLTQQLATLTSLQRQAEDALARHAALRAALDARANELRAQIKALQTDLTAPANFPSIAQIQERLATDARRAALRGMADQVAIMVDELRGVLVELHDAARQRREMLSAVPVESAGRFEAWEGEFKAELQALNFTTLTIDNMAIEQSGKPSHAGYDIAFQGSASDIVRLRWAYLLSLMQTASRVGGNHFGVLVLDEPRQQEVEERDFKTFLLMLARMESGQAIVATSEPADRLENWLAGESASVVSIERQLLQPR
jgi:prefoldin subunit 5